MRLILGTVQFGMDYGVQGSKQPSQKSVDEMLLYALDSGIRVFDTAMAYGEAETVLGRFCASYPAFAAEMRFVSKLQAKAFDGEERERWPQIALENASESLRRLGTNKLEAYLFHNAAMLFVPGTVEALATVEEQGLAKAIGVATYTPQEAMKALEYPQIRAIQIPYNIFDHRLDCCGFFREAKEKKIRIYARSSLLQGLALMQPDALGERMAFARDYLVRFREICARWQMPPLDTAIRYVASNEVIDSIVFGVDTIEQLRKYLSIPTDPLPRQMQEELQAAFDAAEERLVNPTKW